jgi:hypothetical protein
VGVGSRDEIEAAAVVALSGQSARRFLYEPDSFQREVMLKVALRSFELRQMLNEELAAKIIERLAKAMK